MLPPRSPRPVVAGLLAAALCLLGPADALADKTHVVAPGHTLAKIARRYNTTVEALRDANGLEPGQKLKPGQRLVVPEPGSQPATPSDRPSRETDRARAGDEEYDSRNEDRARRGTSRAPAAPPARSANKRGTITLSRADGESWSGKTLGRRSRLLPGVAQAFQRMLRFDAAHTRQIDPRLVAVLTQFSDHFGGRPLEIVSGFRPHSAGQHTTHSNHNLGKALDFAIRGVSNQALRDFCHTLRDVGCGYYPNSSFIHVDVRTGSARWVDESGPGEPPRYSSVNGVKQPSRPPTPRPPAESDEEQDTDASEE
ncbi:MAG TPA: DUF882 domain-containing protein [Polyangiaceae bacterium]|nr:DUF882 domain-containing protein [Polyangiaceae bacterium]